MSRADAQNPIPDSACLSDAPVKYPEILVSPKTRASMTWSDTHVALTPANLILTSYLKRMSQKSLPSP